MFHASLLLPDKETLVHGPNYTRPPPDLTEDAEEYKVEAIINHRHYGRQRRLQYLIKWKGYPSSDNTWELEENVHAEDRVKAYHRRHPLRMDKKTIGRGTKKLIRALLTPTPTSPTDKVRAWLLANSLGTSPFLHIRAVPPPANKYSPSPPISPWLSRPSKSSKSGFQGQAQEMPGSSYNSSHTSFELTSGADGTREPGLAMKALQNALLRTTHRRTSLKTLPCRTPPSGRGRPR